LLVHLLKTGVKNHRPLRAAGKMPAFDLAGFLLAISTVRAAWMPIRWTGWAKRSHTVAA
jgi:hypothetical protein